MITETPTRTRWEDAIMAVELCSFLLCHPERPVVTRLEDKCLRVADTKGTLMHAEVAVIFLYNGLTHSWLCSPISFVHAICILSICQLLCMPLRVIKEKGEVKLWVDYLRTTEMIFVMLIYNITPAITCLICLLNP